MRTRRNVLLGVVCGAGLIGAQDAASGPRDRIKVIRELAKSGSSNNIASLQRYLKDGDVEVRVEAVKAIVAIGTQHSIPPLIEAAQDNDAEIQVRATDGLVNFYYPDYVKTGLTASLRRIGTSIKGRFTDVNDQVIDTFVRVDPAAIETLGKLVRGGVSQEVRANAARAIGVLRGRAAIPDMLTAIRTTKDTQIIYESLVAIRKIGDQAAAPEIAFLLRDLNKKVQVTAIETTGLLQNKEAVPRLIDVYGNASDKDVRRAAMTAIAMLPLESSRSLYEQNLNDKDDGVRAAAAEGLARLKNPADVARLEKMFEDDRKMNPKLSAAFALVMLGKREVSQYSPLQYLVNTLNSASYKGVASAFLIELTREAEVRRSLYSGMEQRTKDEKMELAMILARSGDEETEPVLDALSRDTIPEVAHEGTRALRWLRAKLRK